MILPVSINSWAACRSASSFSGVSSSPCGSRTVAEISLRRWMGGINRSYYQQRWRHTLYTASSRSCNSASFGGKNWKSCLRHATSVTSVVPQIGVHLQCNLLRSARKLWCLLCFARSRTHGFLEIAIDRVIELALSLAQRKRVKVERLVLPGAEIFSVPLLQRAICLEV